MTIFNEIIVPVTSTAASATSGNPNLVSLTIQTGGTTINYNFDSPATLSDISIPANSTYIFPQPVPTGVLWVISSSSTTITVAETIQEGAVLDEPLNEMFQLPAENPILPEWTGSNSVSAPNGSNNSSNALPLTYTDYVSSTTSS